MESIQERIYRAYAAQQCVPNFEVNQNPDSEQRSELRTILRSAHRTIFAGEMEYSRGAELKGLGFKHYDALHIACAESGGVDVFLTTDDRMCKTCETPQRTTSSSRRKFAYVAANDN